MMLIALHWGPGLASGIVDNVPLALAMSYVLKPERAARCPRQPDGLVARAGDRYGRSWQLALSANVVAYAVIETSMVRWVGSAAADHCHATHPAGNAAGYRIGFVEKPYRLIIIVFVQLKRKCLCFIFHSVQFCSYRGAFDDDADGPAIGSGPKSGVGR